jgi:hypothetical protein
MENSGAIFLAPFPGGLRLGLSKGGLRLMSEIARTHKRSPGRPRCNASPDQVRALRSCGLSFRKIAELTGYSYGTVRRAYLRSNSRQYFHRQTVGFVPEPANPGSAIAYSKPLPPCMAEQVIA